MSRNIVGHQYRGFFGISLYIYSGIAILPFAGPRKPGNYLKVVMSLEGFQKLMPKNAIFNYLPP